MEEKDFRNMWGSFFRFDIIVFVVKSIFFGIYCM